LARMCLEEIKDKMRQEKELTGWMKEKGEFWEERGVKWMEWERTGRVGGYEELERRDREKDKEERWEKIRNTRYCKWYQWVKEEGIPGYLGKGWGESRWRRIARFRLGNEIKEGRYWEEERDKLCRLCGNKVETWEHVWEECRSWKEGSEESWQVACDRVLGGMEMGKLG